MAHYDDMNVPYSGKEPEASMVATPKNKYSRTITNASGQMLENIDVYDVLSAFNVVNPALQHLIKKALCLGLRGHKDASEDLQDIIDSAIRARDL